MSMDASMLIPSGLLSPPSLDPSPLSQAVNLGTSGQRSGMLGQHSGSAGQLGGAGQQRTRSSLNPAAPGFQSMRTPVANGLHSAPPKQQATGRNSQQALQGMCLVLRAVCKGICTCDRVLYISTGDRVFYILTCIILTQLKIRAERDFADTHRVRLLSTLARLQAGKEARRPRGRRSMRCMHSTASMPARQSLRGTAWPL